MLFKTLTQKSNGYYSETPDLNNGFYDSDIQIRLRFGMANPINKYLK